MVQLHISTQPIRMEYTTQKAVLSLQTTPAQLSMSTEAAQLDIRQPHGELSIDQSPVRASYGFKDNMTFLLDVAAAARNSALEATGKAVEDGNRMLHIESGEDVVVALATESNIKSSGEVTWAPLAAPEIHFEARPPQISFTPGKLQVNYQPGTLTNNTQNGRVNGRVVQYPSIQFSTSGQNLDVAV